MNNALPRRCLTLLATAVLGAALIPGAVTSALADDPVSPEQQSESPNPSDGTEVPDPATQGVTRADVPEVLEDHVPLGEAEASPAEDPEAEVPVATADTEEAPVLGGLEARLIDTPDAELIGLTWDDHAAPDRVEVRSLNGKDGWGEWTVAELIVEEGGEVTATEVLWIGNAAQVEVRSSRDGLDTTAELDAVLIDSDEVAGDDPATFSAGSGSSGPVIAPMNVSRPGVLAPSVISRAGWGANESWASAPRYASETKAVVLHHTAGSNSYSRTQTASIVRGIYSYHTRTLGWADLGYNVLVDRYGQIFEGRKGGLNRNVIGAHALGSNTGTFGVSMIGNNSSVAPTSAQLAAVADISAWKLGSVYVFDAKSKVEVDQKSQYRIFGHRDARQGATSCPGDRGQAQLPFLRNIINDRLDRFETPSHAAWLRDGGADVLGTVVYGEQFVGNHRETRYSTGLEIERDSAGRVAITDPQVRDRLEFSRRGGSDRYAVSAETSARAFPAGSSHVMIASGQIFTDALASSPVATAEGGPLLLVQGGRIPDPVRAELQRLKPSRITIAGGPGTVNDNVARELARITGAQVTRVGGADRYAVAASLARDTGPLFIASGELFSDALSASSGAALSGGSVLLTRGSTLPASTANVIRQNTGRPVYIVGGTGTISAAVEQSIRGLGAKPVRIGGRDRYEVSVNVAARFAPQGSPQVYLASGNVFPDALSAVSASGVDGSPVLLVRPQTMTADARLYLRKAPTTSAVLVGGPGTLNESITWW